MWQTLEQSGGEGHKHEEGFHHGLDLPSLTIGGLKPRTSYSVRVAVYDDYDTRTLGTSTPVIEVTTDGRAKFALISDDEW